MSKFYTGLGDMGYCSMGASKVRKDDNIINAIGDIDELNTLIGVAISKDKNMRFKERLSIIQNNLFIIGAQLASLIDPMLSLKRSISKEDTVKIESYIEEYAAQIGSLQKFVLPGGTELGATLHHARSVARRAERSVVSINLDIDKNVLAYLNRLSSILFMMALYSNKCENYTESNPTY